MSRVIVQAAPAGSDRYRELVWSKLIVRKSLDDICHTLELTLPVSQRSLIHRHDRIEVRYQNRWITDSGGRRRLTTLVVDDIDDQADADKKTVTVLARSPIRDMLDSVWSGYYDALTLEQLLTTIAADFGLTVQHFPVGQHATEQIPGFFWDDESPWGRLVNEALNQGYLITSNEAGNLYLMRGPRDADQWGLSIRAGQAIRSITSKEFGGEQFRTYIIKGATSEYTQIDPQCAAKRILTIDVSSMCMDEEKLRRRAQMEIMRRRKKETVITMSGWGLSDHALAAMRDTSEKEIFYSPGYLSTLTIPSADIQGTMLINSVEYTADATSFMSSVTLVNKEAYFVH